MYHQVLLICLRSPLYNQNNPCLNHFYNYKLNIQNFYKYVFFRFQLFNNVIVKETVSIISSDTPCKDANALLKALFDQKKKEKHLPHY